MFSAATFALLVGLVSAVQIVPTQFTVLSNGKPTVVSGSSLAVDSPQPTVRYYCANLGGSGPGTICYNGLSNQGNGRKLTYDSDTKRAASRRASKDVCGKGAKRLLKWQGACNALYPNDPSMWATSCDEFPFASTIEGGPLGQNGAAPARAGGAAPKFQSVQGVIQGRLTQLHSRNPDGTFNAKTWSKDGFLHSFSVEFDRLPQADSRLAGAIVLGDTSYAGVATAGTVNVYMQTAPPPPANPPQAPTGSFTQGGRVFGCPKPTAFPVCPPYYKRSFFVEPRRQAGKGGLRRRQTCDVITTPSGQQAAAAADLSTASAAAAALGSLAATSAEQAAAGSAVAAFSSAVDTAGAFVAGTASAAALASAIANAQAALSTFIGFLADDDSEETNEAATTQLQQISDSLSDTLGGLYDTQAVAQGLPANDNGAVPVYLTSSSSSSTTAGTSGPSPTSPGGGGGGSSPTGSASAPGSTITPPPTTTTPPAGGGGYGASQVRGMSSMNDIYKAIASKISAGDCSHAKRTAVPELPKRLHGRAHDIDSMVPELGLSDPSLAQEIGDISLDTLDTDVNGVSLPHIPVTLGGIIGADDSASDLVKRQACATSCSSSDPSSYDYCELIKVLVLYLSQYAQYTAWQNKNATEFAYSAPNTRDALTQYENEILAALPGNATAQAAYNDVVSIYNALVVHQYDAGFYNS